MSKKLAIKRVGSFIPTLCLLVFLLFCITATWLSTVGLPRSVIDKIEQAVAAEGVPIKIEKITLNIFWRAGVVAEDIKIFAAPEDTTPIVTADSLSASFAPLKLFVGEIEPKTLILENGKVALPISDTQDYHELAATNINISAAFHKQFVTVNASELKLQGIPIYLKGAFNIDELMTGESAEEEQEKLVIPAIIKTIQSIVDRTYHQIEEQHWAPNEYPELHLNIAAGKEIKLQVQANAPKYDIDQFCFRDAKIDFDYEGDRFIINNLGFKTIKPDSHVQLKGGYELETRKLTLTLESDAALLEMAKALSEGETLKWLNKFSHKEENCPHIQLQINAEFGEDFSLNTATFNGEIEQKELNIGDSEIEHLFISFFYNDGNFNVDNLTLKFPDGKVKFTAVSNNGQGNAEIQADLSIIRTVSLINEFLTEPLIIPMGLKLGDSMKLTAKADLGMPEFKAGDTYAHHFIPELKKLDVSLALKKLAFLGYELKAPVISLSSCKEQGETDNLSLKAKDILVNLQADEINCAVSDTQQIKTTHSALNIHLQDYARNPENGDIELGAATVELNGKKLDWNGLVSEQFNLKGDLRHLLHSESQSGIKGGELVLNINQLSKEQLTIGALTLTAKADAKEGCTMPDSLADVSVSLDVGSIAYEDKEMGNLHAVLNVPNDEEGKLDLKFTPNDSADTKHATITATTAIEDDATLNIRQLEAYLPCSNLEHVTEALGIQIQDIEMPHDVTLRGDLSLNLDTQSLNHANIKANIPHLVRTPHYIKGFQGEKIKVSVEADIKAQGRENGNVAYSGDVKVNHETGELLAKVEGNTATHLHVTGDNTIRPDIVDQLLDYKDAHEIIRDFRFTQNSKTAINNIVVDVKYDNGLDVAVDCDITLNDVQYQLSAIVEDEDGNEVGDKKLGKLPFTSVTKAITHLRADYREDIVQDGKTLPTVIDITMSDVMLQYDNKPWLQLQDFTPLGLSKQGPGAKSHKTATLTGDKVVIDIENGAVRLTNVKGNVYAAYSLGMFYSDLRDFLSILITPYPTAINTQYCQFPIYSDSKEEMKGHIHVESPKLVGLDFLGTKIPLTRFTGFITLKDDYVYLDRMNALCWNGTVNAAIKIGISDSAPAFDGQVTAQNMDLKKIAKAYKTDMDSALCEANIRFRSKTSDLNDIQAYGKARIVNGNLLSLSIFQPIGAFVSDVTGNIRELDESVKKHKTKNVLQRLSGATGSTINAIGTQLDRTAQYIPGYNHVFAYDLQNAFIDFVIDKGHFKTTKLKALGYNLKVTGVLDINLNNMKIYGNMWPQVSSLPTILLSPITFLSDFMLDIVIYGEVDNLQWEFRLDPRISDNNPMTANSGKDSECPDAPKGKKAATKPKKKK